MKRFMLVSLMSCMLVGQVSCDWSWGEFTSGVSASVAGNVLSSYTLAYLGAVAGAFCGGGEKRANMLSGAAAGAALGSAYTNIQGIVNAFCPQFLPGVVNAFDDETQENFKIDSTLEKSISFRSGRFASSALGLVGLGALAYKLYSK